MAWKSKTQLFISDNGVDQPAGIQETVAGYNGSVPDWVLRDVMKRVSPPVDTGDTVVKEAFPPSGKVELIPRGRVYKLLEYMWDRDVASYDDIIADVLDAEAPPQTIRSLLSRTNVTLRVIAETWTLHADSRSLVVRKRNRQNPKKRNSK